MISPLLLLAIVASAPSNQSSHGLPFLRGGDVSEIPEVEASRTVYRYRGQPIDPFVAMKKAGWNFVRFRVWNDGAHPGKGGDWCDKAHTLALAKRANAQGLAISLDFHYSDWWADPGKQTKPAVWKDLPFDRLVQAVHDFTKDLVSAMVSQGTPSAMVQVGNEIRPGMLWPDGRNDTPEGWTRLARLIEAGCRAVREADPNAKTMIHLDQGGDNRACRGWFDHLRAEGIGFDLIGLSYYPWWHGPLSALKTNLDDLASRYGKDVYVVELGYPWKVDKSPGPRLTNGEKTEPGFPATPQGQAALIRKVLEIVRDVPGGRGKGVLYWAPTWIGPRGRAGGYGNLTLFDAEGNALPGFDAMGGAEAKQEDGMNQRVSVPRYR